MGGRCVSPTLSYLARSGQYSEQTHLHRIGFLIYRYAPEDPIAFICVTTNRRQLVLTVWGTLFLYSIVLRLPACRPVYRHSSVWTDRPTAGPTDKEEPKFGPRRRSAALPQASLPPHLPCIASHRYTHTQTGGPLDHGRGYDQTPVRRKATTTARMETPPQAHQPAGSTDIGAHTSVHTRTHKPHKMQRNTGTCIHAG